MADPHALSVITLTWGASDDGGVAYTLSGVQDDGQIRLIGSTTQGPFDTSLEVAQWAWRLISRELPPSRC